MRLDHKASAAVTIPALGFAFRAIAKVPAYDSHTQALEDLCRAGCQIGELGHCQESRMLLITQLIAFWFCQLTAEHRVLYRPRWLANSQCAACKGQANSKQIARSGRQSIINGPSLPSINNGLLFPCRKQFASEI